MRIAFPYVVTSMKRLFMLSLVMLCAFGCDSDEGSTQKLNTLIFSDPNLTSCVQEAVLADDSVTQASQLTDLDCSSGNLTDISDIGLLSALISVNFDNNRLISVSALSNLESLQRVSARENLISVTPDFSETGISSLDLAYNKIIDTDLLASVSTLEVLDLEHNLLTNVSDFMDKVNFVKLNLGKNGSVNCSSLTTLIDNLGVNSEGASVVSPSDPTPAVDCYDDSGH